MVEVLSTIAKASPGLAVALVAIVLLYRLASRALDALEKNTEALATLKALMLQDRRT